MNGVSIEWKHEGFADIECSDAVRSVCMDAANSIKTRADGGISGESSGYKVSSHIGNAYGSRRVIVNVSTSDHASAVAEAENKALSKAVM